MNEAVGNGINRRQALLAGAAGAAAIGLFSGAKSAAAQTPEAAGELSSDLVIAGMSAALTKATEIGVPSVVSVYSRTGTLLGFVRQDGALGPSSTFAQQKAFTAAAFGAPSADFAQAVSADPALMASILKIENVTLIGGGLPIISGGVLLGGIGASGGSVDQDIEVATAGLAAMGLS